MSGNRWGPAGPPEEAYGRVTNSERFASLHDVAKRMADELCGRFAVSRIVGDEVDEELIGTSLDRGMTLARPTVRLVPEHADQAGIVVAFTRFPGLRVRFGPWHTRSFPECGCDACDETPEGEAERLRWHMTNVAEGRYRETLRVDRDGTSWIECEFWSGSAWSRAREPIDPDRARLLLVERGGGSRQFRPWSPR
jgi:hypothetical protein